MFTQPVSSPPPGPQGANPVPVSPSRPSRLRGLTYLRNYTHNHLLSRDSHHSSSSSSSTNTNTNANASSSLRSSQTQNGNLTRSVSYTPASTISPASQNPNRLTLVSTSPDAAPALSPRVIVRENNGASSSSPPPTIPETTSSTSPQALAASQTTSPDSTSNNGQSNMTATRPRAVSDAPAASSAPNGTAAASASAAVNSAPDTVPSIRFSAHYDLRSTRPSLSFSPISRTLPNGTEVIRVGRYSERDGQAANMNNNQPSAAPVGFKSKVVSRRHCEFWCEDGKWFIKDVKSSSGTFLNHIRLSGPSQESKAYPVNDGDIVQLGIDFKGGEEMIFRCVKMRLELNRGWQNKLNSFNVAAHKRLRTMTTSAPAGAASGSSSQSSQDCSICLNSIAPCQSLFVAPCSHTWHFKCVRLLLTSPQYPIFVCPNCRAGADLEADVDEPSEEWQQLEDGGMDADKKESENSQSGESPVADPTEAAAPDPDAMDVDVTMSVNVSDSPQGRPAGSSLHAASEPLPITNPASGSGRVGHLREHRSPSPSSSGAEGPITPRNNAGPWVFDGSAGQRAAAGSPEMRSLDAAAEMDVSGGANQSDDSIR
ncbi:hypothetical protein J3459_015992 [Metarhizium acridum]|uniref:uncharacterized protein n=1 Tax=Metarhizium acridum TaxID=92637 RepID=UPI001C6A9575|nr:hypothetical protein J3458_020312 [Metarhizium acridum]KAG8412109.1 hypothetical protein J3459_015992 [Metarhizium acridum]